MNSDTERNAALQLNADYRFDHFISKLVEHEELFVLTDEHGVMMLTTEEEDCIPVWPHPDYAKAWAEGEWAECKAAVHHPQGVAGSLGGRHGAG